jgi:DNA transformation protein
MAIDSAYVADVFSAMGPVTVKRMFGGAGVYSDGVMFALVWGDGDIGVKVDDALKAELSALGSTPFIWVPESGPRAGEPVEMGYWRLPPSALDDPEEAAAWGRTALAVAQAKAAKKKGGGKKERR